jgi:hypothetical protein
LVGANLPDELLRQYFEIAGGADRADPDDILATLVLDYALPEIRRVVERRLRGAARETLEDVCSTATAWLIASLRRGRNAQPPVRDFAAYSAGVAAKAVAQHIADRFPERARLRRKLRLLCSSDDRFFLGEAAGGWRCGLRAHQQCASASPQAIEECRAELAATRLPPDFEAFVRLFFGRLGAPADLSEATAAVAGLLGVAGPPESLDALAVEPAAETPPPGVVGTPEWVRRLWDEIRLLPLGQRFALLLNLRLPHGSAIGLFEELGVADIASLAETVDMPAAELAGLWGRLPLDDLEIAARLGVTRQQVINLRAAARERLRRRTGGCQYDREIPDNQGRWPGT